MKIRIAPGNVLLFLLLALGGNMQFPAALAAALFHELGHLVAARFLGVRIRLMEIDLFGAKLYPAGIIPSYRAEVLLAAAGPLFSLLLGVFLLPLDGAFATATRLSTFSFALFNLLPIGEFDGGRMVLATLSPLAGERIASRVLAVCSYLSLLFLFCLSSCLLLKHGQNLTLAVLSASLFAKFFLH